jgi:hypothetical protein
MSRQTETLLTGINGNVCAIIQQLGDLERSISSLNDLFKKFIENHEAQVSLLQEMAQADRAECDISKPSEAR